jgi:tetratricopeptide (TPR) repeat protein
MFQTLVIVLPAVVALAVIAFVWRRWMDPAAAVMRRIEAVESRALQMLQAGESWPAEQMLQQLVDDVSREHGSQSRAAGRAIYAQSLLMLGMEDYPRAIGALRTASQLDPIDAPSLKDRLTYQMNLGELLSRSGQHDEAESVLSSSLDERRKFYGEQHSGYAYGLESLAAVVLRAGRPDDALPLVDQAIQIDRASGNPHLSHDVALKAAILHSRKPPPANGFPDWPQLDPQRRGEAIMVCHVLSDSLPPAVALSVYGDLKLRLAEAPSADPHDPLRVLTAITNTARLAGNHGARVDAFREIIRNLDSGHETAVTAWLGLAAAQNDAGRADEADQSYLEAASIADRLSSPRVTAQVSRNHAIHLAETGRTDEADQTHARAVAAARQSGDDEMLGRTVCARAIFLQHQGRLDDAIPLLDEALLLLPAAHPDAFCAHSHLTAARDNRSCGCDEAHGDALARVLERLVLDRAPPGLVKQIHVNLDDTASPISVEAARKPTEEEGRQLYGAVQNAIGEMRRRQAAAGYSS